jgi:hypothetical protein
MSGVTVAVKIPERSSVNCRTRTDPLADDPAMARRRGAWFRSEPLGDLRQPVPTTDDRSPRAGLLTRAANASFICTTREPLSVTTTRSIKALKVSFEQTALLEHFLSSWTFSTRTRTDGRSRRWRRRTGHHQDPLARLRQRPCRARAAAAEARPGCGPPPGGSGELRPIEPEPSRRDGVGLGLHAGIRRGVGPV